jgi:hypothetical protein
MHCAQCGTAGTGKFCERCGSPLSVVGPQETKFCSSCGTVLEGASSYCSHCGSARSQSQVADRYVPPSPPPSIPAQAPAATGQGFSRAALGAGIAAVLFLPIILGPLGLILGAVGWSRGEKLAPVAVAVSLVGTLVGMWLGAVVWMNSGF